MCRLFVVCCVGNCYGLKVLENDTQPRLFVNNFVHAASRSTMATLGYHLRVCYGLEIQDEGEGKNSCVGRMS